MSFRAVKTALDPVVDSRDRGFVSNGPLAEALETTIVSDINCT